MRQFAAILILWMVAALVCAQQTVTILPKPASGYVLDQAGMLTPEAISQINFIAEGAQRSVEAPIVVVTIPSLASVGATDVEFYATTLFNAWAIGNRRSNRGVLLLVAREDRKARIELGAGWGYTRDADCREIMDGWIIPNFKAGDYSKGIIQGVQALDSMVRTGKVPRPPMPVWFWPGMGGTGAFIFFLIRDLIMHGFAGWGWAFLRGLGRFAIQVLSSSGSGSSSSSGGGGGGFSGGGSSGGGGASGSW